MEKVLPISIELINKAKKLKKEFSDLNEIIIDRIDYIITFIYKASSLKGKNFSWWFDGADENEVGDFWVNYNISNGEICFLTDPQLSMLIIDKYGDMWECGGSIPDRWLFEDFENEIIEGEKMLEEMNAKKNSEKLQLKEQNKSERQKLIDSARKKLSKQELKALGLSKL